MSKMLFTMFALCLFLILSTDASNFFVIRNFYGGILTDNGVQTNRVHFECSLTGNNQIWRRIDATFNSPPDNVACSPDANYLFQNYETNNYLYSQDEIKYIKVTNDNTDDGICWIVQTEDATSVDPDFAFSKQYERLRSAATKYYPKSGQNCYDPNGITAVDDNKKDDTSLFVLESIQMTPK